MRLGTFVLASMCGMVGLVAGRASAPGHINVVAAAPAPRVEAIKLVPVVAEPTPEPTPEPSSEPEDDGGQDLGAVLAAANQRIAEVERTHEAIRGRVSDPRGEGVPGVTVIATSNNINTQTAITDEHGNYQILDLPSASYLVTIYYGDMSFEYPGIATTSFEPTSLDISFDPNGPGRPNDLIVNYPPPPPAIAYEPANEYYNVPVGRTFGDVSGPYDDSAMTIGDGTQNDNNNEIEIDKNYIKNIPVPGRTFEAALGAAADTQGDSYGVSFTGVTALENTYVIDGINGPM